MAKVGRPKSNNPREFTIPEIRVTKEENRMIKLKAALYAGNSVAKFLRMAAEKYKEELPDEKCLCGGKMKVVLDTETFDYEIADEKVSIKVNNIPMYKCENCGKMKENLFLMAALEEAIDHEIIRSMRERQKIPEEIDFQSFLEVKTTSKENKKVHV
ncbi:hypothetical protein [Thermicanus aegyptius]|uniref:hypothetical protein n=1 Tax=Thermicanus aegyptius TaxID=94009 RepID=UPI00048D774E|nr:hypothetical protein [Thermicanus aegyptius]